MGEASRRGTFGKRKKEAVIRNKASLEIRKKTVLELEEKRKAGLSLQERSLESRNRIAMISFMATANRLGFSPKEMKRRMIRFKKKGD